MMGADVIGSLSTATSRRRRGRGADVARRKTAEEKADERRRHALARAASTDAEFEPLLDDGNQAIRNEAAMNPRASAEVLDRFAEDRFWSVRVAVAEHPHAAGQTLLWLLESDPRKRGVVHAAARKRLESEGIRFGDDGLPLGG